MNWSFRGARKRWSREAGRNFSSRRRPGREPLAVEPLEGRRLLAGFPLRVGGAEDDAGNSVTRLADGSMILTGSFRGTATFGDKSLTSLGKRDIFVAKFDPLGTCVWAVRAGGTGDDHGSGIATLADGKSVVLTGLFSSSVTFGGTTLNAFHVDGPSIFVARMNASGAFTWAVRSQGTGSFDSPQVAAFADDSVVVAGNFWNGTVWFTGVPGLPTTSQDVDMFVSKLDSAGQGVWCRVVGGAGKDSFKSVAAVSDGSAVVTGSFEGTVKVGATTLNAYGGVFDEDVLVARLTPAGQFAWAKRAGGPGADRGRAVTALADGSVVVAGTYSHFAFFGVDDLLSPSGTTRNMFVARLTPAGFFDWATRVGDSSSVPNGIATQSNGISVAVSGTFRKNAADPDNRGLFVYRITGAGVIGVPKFSGGTSSIGGFTSQDEPRVAVLADGSIVVAGTCQEGAAAFGGTSLPGSGGSDVFLARLKAASFDLPPAAVTGLAGVPGAGSVQLSWKPPAPSGGPAVDDYIVQYRPANQRIVAWTTMPAAPKSTATSEKVTGLINGLPYLFRVAAASTAGSGPWVALPAAVAPRTVPGAPTAVTAVGGNGLATLSWKPPATNGGAAITGYLVQHTTNFSSWTTVPGLFKGTTATVAGLVNGVAYTFRVAAVNAVGSGGFGMAAAVVPLTVPGVPKGFVVYKGNGVAGLVWSPPDSTGGSPLTSYRIIYAKKVGAGWGPWVTLDRPASLPTTFAVGGLANGSTYVFQIAAANAAGFGPFTAPGVLVTPGP